MKRKNTSISQRLRQKFVIISASNSIIFVKKSNISPCSFSVVINLHTFLCSSVVNPLIQIYLFIFDELQITNYPPTFLIYFNTLINCSRIQAGYKCRTVLSWSKLNKNLNFTLLKISSIVRRLAPSLSNSAYKIM